MVLEIFFLSFSNTDFQFNVRELIWRSYIVVEALPTTNQVKLIDKREFVKVTLDENSETFVIHISILEDGEASNLSIESRSDSYPAIR